MTKLNIDVAVVLVKEVFVVRNHIGIGVLNLLAVLVFLTNKLKNFRAEINLGWFES